MEKGKIIFLITGHGQFATGINDAIEMIAGKADNSAFIPFSGKSVAAYEEELTQFFTDAAPENVICFTDLLGGTPNKSCSKFSLQYSNVFVLSGTNLGMILEGLGLRLFVTDPYELCKQLVNTGKEGITFFEPDTPTESPSDGI